MAAVFLIFLALFVYWAVSARRDARTAARHTAVSAVRRTVPRPTSAGRFGVFAAPRHPTAARPAPEGPVRTVESAPLVADRYLLEADRDSLVAHAEVRHFGACDLIMKEGDEAFGICVLLTGRVGLLVEVGGGRQVLVDTVRPGELFAWSGAVPPFHYTATGHAIVDSDVAVLGRDELEKLCEADPVLGYHLMRELTVVVGRRVRDLEMQLTGLC